MRPRGREPAPFLLSPRHGGPETIAETFRKRTSRCEQDLHFPFVQTKSTEPAPFQLLQAVVQARARWYPPDTIRYHSVPPQDTKNDTDTYC